MTKLLNHRWHVALTAGGLGYSPVMPGTVASLATALAIRLTDVAWMPSNFHRATAFLILATMIVIAGMHMLGGPNARVRDDGRIVLDEVAGMLIAAAGGGGLPGLVGAFALFRFFDIAKPLGIRSIDARGTAWSLFLDDVAAGVLSLALITLVSALT